MFLGTSIAESAVVSVSVAVSSVVELSPINSFKSSSDEVTVSVPFIVSFFKT